MYLYIRRTPSLSTAIILTHHPNPFRDLLRSSQLQDLNALLTIVEAFNKEITDFLITQQSLIPDPSHVTFQNLDNPAPLIKSPLIDTLPKPETDTLAGLSMKTVDDSFSENIESLSANAELVSVLTPETRALDWYGNFILWLLDVCDSVGFKTVQPGKNARDNNGNKFTAFGALTLQKEGRKLWKSLDDEIISVFNKTPSARLSYDARTDSPSVLNFPASFLLHRIASVYNAIKAEVIRADAWEARAGGLNVDVERAHIHIVLKGTYPQQLTENVDEHLKEAKRLILAVDITMRDSLFDIIRGPSYFGGPSDDDYGSSDSEEYSSEEDNDMVDDVSEFSLVARKERKEGKKTRKKKRPNASSSSSYVRPKKKSRPPPKSPSSVRSAPIQPTLSPQTLFKNDKAKIAQVSSFFSNLKAPYPAPANEASGAAFFRFIRPQSFREKAKYTLEKVRQSEERWEEQNPCELALPYKTRLFRNHRYNPHPLSQPLLRFASLIAQCFMKYMTTFFSIFADDEMWRSFAVATAWELEGEIYKLHPFTSSPTKEYMNKFKSLKFNLDDPRNMLLCARVLSGEITLSELASMTTKELASEEMKKFRNAREEANLKNRLLSVDSSKEGGINGETEGDGSVEGEGSSSSVAPSSSSAEPVKPKPPSPTLPSMPLLPAQPVFRGPPKLRQLPRLPSSPPSSPQGISSPNDEDSDEEREEGRRKKREKRKRKEQRSVSESKEESFNLVSDGSSLQLAQYKCKDDASGKYELVYEGGSRIKFSCHIQTPNLNGRIPRISHNLKSAMTINRPRHATCVPFFREKMRGGKYEFVPLKISVDRGSNEDKEAFESLCKDLEANDRLGLCKTKTEGLNIYLVPPAFTSSYGCLNEVATKGKEGTMWCIYLAKKGHVKWQESKLPDKGPQSKARAGAFITAPTLSPISAPASSMSFDNIDFGAVQSSLNMLNKFDTLPTQGVTQSFDTLPPQPSHHQHRHWQQQQQQQQHHHHQKHYQQHQQQHQHQQHQQNQRYPNPRGQHPPPQNPGGFPSYPHPYPNNNYH